MKNETMIQNEVIVNTNISDGAYRLYVLLQSMCYGNKVNCYPSQKYLAEKLNKSIRTIQRYMDELVNNNLIKKKRRGSISNLITVIAKVIKEKEQVVTNGVKKAYSTYKVKKRGFCDYKQRKYNFDKLEKAMRGECELVEALLE